MSTIANLVVKFSGDTRDLDQAVQRVGRNTSMMAQDLGRIGAQMTAGITVPLMGATFGLVKMAADTESATARMSTNFRDLYDDMYDYLVDLQRIAPASMLELQSSASGAMGALTTLGIEQKLSNEMTKEALAVAANLSAHMNIPFQQALDSVARGYAGNTQSLRDMAFNINQAMIDAKALELGLEGVEEGAYGSARALAVHALVMEQMDGFMDAAEKQSGTLNYKLRVLWGTLQDIGAGFGAHLLPMVKSIVDVLQSMLDVVKAMSPEVQKFVLVVGGIAAALGPGLIIVSRLMLILPALMGPLGLVGGGFLTVRFAILAVTAAASLLGLSLTGSLEGIVQFVRGPFNYAWVLARDSVITFIEAITGNWISQSGIRPLHDLIGRFASFLRTTVVWTFVLVRDAIISLGEALRGDWVDTDGIRALHRVFGNLGRIIRAVVVPAFNLFIWVMERLWNVVKSLTGTGAGMVSTPLGRLASGFRILGDYANRAAHWVGDSLGRIADSLENLSGAKIIDVGRRVIGSFSGIQYGELASTMIDNISSALRMADWSSIPRAFQSIFGSSGFVRQLAPAALSFTSGLLTRISNAFEGVEWGRRVSGMFSGFTSALSSFVESVAENEFVDTFLRVVRDTFNLANMGSIASSIVSGITSALSSLGRTEFRSMGTALINLVRSAIEWAIEQFRWRSLGDLVTDSFIGGIRDSISGAVSGGISSIGGFFTDLFDNIFGGGEETRIIAGAGLAGGRLGAGVNKEVTRAIEMELSGRGLVHQIIYEWARAIAWYIHDAIEWVKDIDWSKPAEDLMERIHGALDREASDYDWHGMAQTIAWGIHDALQSISGRVSSLWSGSLLEEIWDSLNEEPTTKITVHDPRDLDKAHQDFIDNQVTFRQVIDELMQDVFARQYGMGLRNSISEWAAGIADLMHTSLEITTDDDQWNRFAFRLAWAIHDALEWAIDFAGRIIDTTGLEELWAELTAPPEYTFTTYGSGGGTYTKKIGAAFVPELADELIARQWSEHPPNQLVDAIAGWLITARDAVSDYIANLDWFYLGQQLFNLLVLAMFFRIPGISGYMPTWLQRVFAGVGLTVFKYGTSLWQREVINPLRKAFFGRKDNIYDGIFGQELLGMSRGRSVIHFAQRVVQRAAAAFSGALAGFSIGTLGIMTLSGTIIGMFEDAIARGDWLSVASGIFVAITAALGLMKFGPLLVSFLVVQLTKNFATIALFAPWRVIATTMILGIIAALGTLEALLGTQITTWLMRVVGFIAGNIFEVASSIVILLALGLRRADWSAMADAFYEGFRLGYRGLITDRLRKDIGVTVDQFIGIMAGILGAAFLTFIIGPSKLRAGASKIVRQIADALYKALKLHPWRMLIVGAIALALLAFKDWDRLERAAKFLWEGFLKLVDIAISEGKSFARHIADWIGENASDAGQFVRNVAGLIQISWEYIQTVPGEAFGWIRRTFTGIDWEDVAMMFFRGLSSAIRSLPGMLSAAQEWMERTFGEINWMNVGLVIIAGLGAIRFTGMALMPVATAVWTGIKAAFYTLIGKGSTQGVSIGRRILEFLRTGLAGALRGFNWGTIPPAIIRSIQTTIVAYTWRFNLFPVVNAIASALGAAALLGPWGAVIIGAIATVLLAYRKMDEFNRIGLAITGLISVAIGVAILGFGWGALIIGAIAAALIAYQRWDSFDGVAAAVVTALGAAILAFMAGFGWVALIFGPIALALAAYRFEDELSALMPDKLQFIVDAFSSVGELIVEGFWPTVEAVLGNLESAWKIFKDSLIPSLENFGETWDRVRENIGTSIDVFSRIGENFGTIVGNIKEFLGLTEGIDAGGGEAAGSLRDLWDVISEPGWGTLLIALGGLLSTINAVIGALPGLAKIVGNAIGAAVELIGLVVEAVSVLALLILDPREGIKALSDFLENLSETLPGIGQMISGSFDGLGEAVRGAIDEYKSSLGEMARPFSDEIADAIESDSIIGEAIVLAIIGSMTGYLVRGRGGAVVGGAVASSFGLAIANSDEWGPAGEAVVAGVVTAAVVALRSRTAAIPVGAVIASLVYSFQNANYDDVADAFNNSLSAAFLASIFRGFKGGMIAFAIAQVLQITFPDFNWDKVADVLTAAFWGAFARSILLRLPYLSRFAGPIGVALGGVLYSIMSFAVGENGEINWVNVGLILIGALAAGILAAVLGAPAIIIAAAVAVGALIVGKIADMFPEQTQWLADKFMSALSAAWDGIKWSWDAITFVATVIWDDVKDFWEVIKSIVDLARKAIDLTFSITVPIGEKVIEDIKFLFGLASKAIDLTFSISVPIGEKVIEDMKFLFGLGSKAIDLIFSITVPIGEKILEDLVVVIGWSAKVIGFSIKVAWLAGEKIFNDIKTVFDLSVKFIEFHVRVVWGAGELIFNDMMELVELVSRDIQFIFSIGWAVGKNFFDDMMTIITWSGGILFTVGWAAGKNFFDDMMTLATWSGEILLSVGSNFLDDILTVITWSGEILISIGWATGKNFLDDIVTVITWSGEIAFSIVWATGKNFLDDMLAVITWAGDITPGLSLRVGENLLNDLKTVLAFSAKPIEFVIDIIRGDGGDGGDGDGEDLLSRALGVGKNVFDRTAVGRYVWPVAVEVYGDMNEESFDDIPYRIGSVIPEEQRQINFTIDLDNFEDDLHNMGYLADGASSHVNDAFSDIDLDMTGPLHIIDEFGDYVGTIASSSSQELADNFNDLDMHIATGPIDSFENHVLSTADLVGLSVERMTREYRLLQDAVDEAERAVMGFGSDIRQIEQQMEFLEGILFIFDEEGNKQINPTVDQAEWDEVFDKYEILQEMLDDTKVKHDDANMAWIDSSIAGHEFGEMVDAVADVLGMSLDEWEAFARAGNNASQEIVDELVILFAHLDELPEWIPDDLEVKIDLHRDIYEQIEELLGFSLPKFEEMEDAAANIPAGALSGMADLLRDLEDLPTWIPEDLRVLIQMEIDRQDEIRAEIEAATGGPVIVPVAMDIRVDQGGSLGDAFHAGEVTHAIGDNVYGDDWVQSISSGKRISWDYLFEDLQPAADAATSGAANSIRGRLVPESPPAEGPLAGLYPDWSYLFSSLAEEAEVASEGAAVAIAIFISEASQFEAPDWTPIFENLTNLANRLNEDWSERWNNVWVRAVTFFPSVEEMTIGSLLTGLSGLSSRLGEGWSERWDNVWARVVAYKPEVEELTFGNLFTYLTHLSSRLAAEWGEQWNNVWQRVVSFKPAAEDLTFGNLMSYLSDLANRLEELWSDRWNNVWMRVVTFFPLLSDTTIGSILGFLQDLADRLAEAWSDRWNNVWNSLLTTTIDIGSTALGTILNGLEELWDFVNRDWDFGFLSILPGVGGGFPTFGAAGGNVGGIIGGPATFTQGFGHTSFSRSSGWYGAAGHTGYDWAAPTGTPVGSYAAGTVVGAGWMGGYGNAVEIAHGGGLSTLYAHLSEIAVNTGQMVSQGQMIGRIGSTGASTGPHLHFEVRQNGVPQDPGRYLGVGGGTPGLGGVGGAALEHAHDVLEDLDEEAAAAAMAAESIEKSMAALEKVVDYIERVTGMTINTEGVKKITEQIKHIAEHAVESLGWSAKHLESEEEGIIEAAQSIIGPISDAFSSLMQGLDFIGMLSDEEFTWPGFDYVMDMISDLVHFSEHAVESLGWAAKELSEEGLIESAAEIAGSIESAFGSLSVALDFIGRIDEPGDFPDFGSLKRWVSELKFLIQHTVESIGWIALYLDDENEGLIPSSDRIASTIEKAFTSLMTALDFVERMGDINEWPGIDTMRGNVSDLKWLAQHMIESLGWIALYLDDQNEGLIPSTELIAGTIGIAFEALHDGLDFVERLGEMDEWPAIDTIRGNISDLKWLAQHMIESLGWIAMYLDNENDGLISSSDRISSSIGTAFEALGQGLDVVERMGSFSEWPAYETMKDMASDIKFLVEHMIESLGWTALYLGPEMISKATSLAEIMTGIFEPFIAALEFIQAVQSVTVEDFHHWTTALEEQFYRIVDDVAKSMDSLASDWDDKLMSEVNRAANGMLGIFAPFNAALSFIQAAQNVTATDFHHWTTALEEQFYRIVDDVAKSMESFASDWDEETMVSVRRAANEMAGLFGPFHDVVNFLSAIQDLTIGQFTSWNMNLKSAMHQMIQDTVQVLASIEDEIGEDVIGQSSRTAQALAGVFNPFMEALSLLGMSQDLTRADFNRVNRWFQGDLQTMFDNAINTLTELAEKYTPEMLEQSHEIAQSFSELFGHFESIAQIMTALQEMPLLTKSWMDQFTNVIGELLEMTLESEDLAYQIRDSALAFMKAMQEAAMYIAQGQAAMATSGSTSGVTSGVVSVPDAPASMSGGWRQNTPRYIPSPGTVNMFRGGVINEHIWGIGLSGTRYEFGEHGAEKVTPLTGPSRVMTPAFDHGDDGQEGSVSAADVTMNLYTDGVATTKVVKKRIYNTQRMNVRTRFRSRR